MKKVLIVAAMLSAAPMLAQAGEGGAAIHGLLDKYKSEGAGPFSAEAGKKMWTQVIPFEKKGEMFTDRSCATCHNSPPTTPGKHKKTGKEIAPMTLASFGINKKTGEKEPRFGVEKKVRKWFKRNCKWTYGRECTPQEKGDFLTYFKSL